MSKFAEGTPTKTITLDGKEYTLGFTMGALRRAKELGVLDLNVENEVEQMLHMPELVWCCLLEEDRGALSVQQIAEMINPDNVVELAQATGELFVVSMPKEKPGKNGQPAAVKKPTAGKNKSLTSKSSGQSASTISA